MKKKFLLIYSMVITFFIVVVPNVLASSPFIIGEEKAGGYQYSVIKEQNTYTWKIGHQDNVLTIEENKNNIEELELFRNAVEDINMQIVKIIISASYFLIVVITMVILYKKNKQMIKDSGIVTSIELNTAFQDANFYFLELTN